MILPEPRIGDLMQTSGIYKRWCKFAMRFAATQIVSKLIYGTFIWSSETMETSKASVIIVGQYQFLIGPKKLKRIQIKELWLTQHLWHFTFHWETMQKLGMISKPTAQPHGSLINVDMRVLESSDSFVDVAFGLKKKMHLFATTSPTCERDNHLQKSRRRSKRCSPWFHLMK